VEKKKKLKKKEKVLVSRGKKIQKMPKPTVVEIK